MSRGIIGKAAAVLTAMMTVQVSIQYPAQAAENGLKDSGLSYKETVETISNPGAGYTTTVWASCAPGETPVYSPTAGIVLFFIDIGKFSSGINGTTAEDGTYIPGKDYDLDDAFFDAWRETLDNCRKNGCMVGMRFRYDTKGKADPEPATFAQVLAHIEQIKNSGILSDNADIIAFVESGFVGKWGEQHGGKYTTVEYKAQLLDAMLDAVPEDIPVTVRTPDTFAQWAGIKRSQLNDPELMRAAETGASEEQKRILSRRVGMYDDGYMGSNTDLGTYSDRTKETAWLGSVTTDTYFGGEFSGDTEFAQTFDTYLPENAIPEMYKTHLSYINSNIFPLYKEYTFGPDCDVAGADNSAYYGESVFRFIRDHLGYRFVLRRSELDPELEQGGTLHLRFSVENTGFANPVRHTQGSVVLEKDGTYIKAPVSLDSHNWSSCTTTDCALDIKLPDSIAAGEWNVYLKETMGGYYDEAAEMSKRSIRFANEGTWNSTLGANLLGRTEVKEAGRHGTDNTLHEVSRSGHKNGTDRSFNANSGVIVDGGQSYDAEWTEEMQIASNAAGQSISVRGDEEYLYVMSHMPTGAKAPVYNIELRVPGQNNERYWLYYESGGFIYFNHDDRGACDCKWSGDTVEFRLPYEVFGIQPGDKLSGLRVFLQDSANSWKLLGDIKAAECTVPSQLTVYSSTSELRLHEGQRQELRVSTPAKDAKYQWYKDGSPITGATGAAYTIEKAAKSDAGRYTVKITSGGIVGEAHIADILEVQPLSTTAGDVNSDGAVTIADLIMLERWLLCTGEITAPENAELTGDRKVNAYDMVQLRKLLTE